jgi:ketosteroid isomerase-like protein
MEKDDLEGLARGFFEAYGAGDMDRVRAALAEDVVSWITNAEGGADRVDGRDAYMARLPDTSEAELKTSVTQVLAIDDELVMTMIEIVASRHDRDLHNFAAFLARIRNARIQELWMVEARPAYSDEFWS